MNIQIRDLSASYGSRLILDKLNLDFSAEEFTGIIGPNGSGKSTLLKCIYRVLEPSNGEVLIDNKPLQKMSYKESAKCTAVLAQHSASGFDFTVREVVLMGRTPYKGLMERNNDEDYAIAEDAMDKTGVLKMADMSYLNLSGGEQQRVMLARALAQQTPCLILDEPTNHLDITYQLQIMDIICRNRVTTIAAIHDLNIAAMYCDRLIALKDGKIVADGLPEKVLTEKLIWNLYHVKADIFLRPDGRPAVIFDRKE